MPELIGPAPQIDVNIPKYPRDISAIHKLTEVIRVGVNGGLPDDVQGTLEGIGQVGGPDSPAEALQELVRPYGGASASELKILAEQLFDGGCFAESSLARLALEKLQDTHNI